MNQAAWALTSLFRSIAALVVRPVTCSHAPDCSLEVPFSFRHENAGLHVLCISSSLTVYCACRVFDAYHGGRAHAAKLEMLNGPTQQRVDLEAAALAALGHLAAPVKLRERVDFDISSVLVLECAPTGIPTVQCLCKPTPYAQHRPGCWSSARPLRPVLHPHTPGALCLFMYDTQHFWMSRNLGAYMHSFTKDLVAERSAEAAISAFGPACQESKLLPVSCPGHSCAAAGYSTRLTER